MLSRMSQQTTATALAALLARHAEWFCTIHTARGRCETFPLQSAECTLQASGTRLLLSFWSTRGAELWHVAGYEETDGKLTLHVTRQAGRETARLELVPRTGAAIHVAEIRTLRETRLAQLAATVQQMLGREAKVESARLTAGRRGGEPGRFARLRLTTSAQRIFVTGAVAGRSEIEVENFLAAALLWFHRRGAQNHATRNRSARDARLWLVAAPHAAPRLAERCALLRDGWRELISVWMTPAEDDFASLASVRVPTLEELCARVPRRPRRGAAGEFQLSDTAQRIVALAPEAVTAHPARHGETLRFRGLRFARVRRLMNRELAWFGVEGIPAMQRRRELCAESEAELVALVESLRAHRCHDAPARRHALYTAGSESWLEANLRERITRLDPGLAFAPVYAQLRVASQAASARPLDLLARRRDGRLVVIELKTAEDSALPFQAADYWRQVEAHRRAGHLAHLFGDAHIADVAPLVYVVAPTLRFAHSFEFLASLVHTQIEIYRFDINEDWRAGIQVQRRTRIAPASDSSARD